MTTTSRDGRHVGLICDRDHEVFTMVGEHLAQRGYHVTYFEPGHRIDAETIEALDLLANKKLDPESMRALQYAETHDIATWNGYLSAMLGARPLGMIVLQAAGFRVPLTTFEPPEGEYVAKSLIDWHSQGRPEINGEGGIYQELLPADPIDQKYYAVDDGDAIHVTVVRAISKLYGDKEYLSLETPNPQLARKTATLLEMTGSQAIGVDVVESRGDAYAVDVNPAMSFRHTGLESVLATSMTAHIDAAPTGSIVGGDGAPVDQRQQPKPIVLDPR